MAIRESAGWLPEGTGGRGGGGGATASGEAVSRLHDRVES